MKYFIIAIMVLTQAGCSVFPTLLGYEETVEVYNNLDDVIEVDARDAALDLGLDFRSRPRIASGGSMTFYFGNASIRPKIEVYYHGQRRIYDVSFGVMGYDTIEVNPGDFPRISN
jgi:hypothetical protein